MGEVYLAHDSSLNRDVAIKLLSSGRAENHDARRRFLREAQAAAKLDHPCICQVFEIGEADDGRVYIAMPYVEGETLASRLERGPLPVREALDLLLHTAEALSVAHGHGIVHRDLKPQNVMLTPGGLPKLLDFGIAKLTPAGPTAAAASTVSGDTADGAVVGTPAYMAPEQIAGQDVDARCDLFALGAVAFECLTGRRAFEGRTVLELAGAVTHANPPPVSTLRPDVPSGIDELCDRLLAKHPIDRFQTADEVVGALRLLTTASASGSRREAALEHAKAPRRRWRMRVAAVLAGVAVVAIGRLIYELSQRLPEPPAEAIRWYHRGTDFIREGAFHSANEALEQAIRAFPDYPLAYARQAEALAEIDDQAHARERLLRMQSVLGDEGRLAPEDRLRLHGIRAIVLRELPQAVEAYRELVARAPTDAGAWVDLGRAQEAAEERSEARQSYEKARSIDPALAPASLRLASIDAQSGRRDSALKAYGEAERLYKAASNVEGETEALLRRGMFLDATGEASTARGDLERALALATGSGSRAQSIRGRLALGSLAASEGQYADAERLVAAATDDARRHELWTLVADGLIDMAGVLVNQPRRFDEADRIVQEAAQLANGRGAQRTAARAALQRASLALQRQNPALARDLATSTLAFLGAKGYRRLELTALSIVSRAERDLDDLTSAHTTASRVLKAARDLHDDASVSIALSSLASIASAGGDLPAALAARTEAERLNQQMGQREQEPFDLGNRADLLIRLGRSADAEPLLRALDAGIGSGNEAFKGREPRASYLRALAAIVNDDLAAAVRHARAVVDAAGPASTVAEARALLGYALARLGRPGTGGRGDSPVASPSDERELVYWRALEASARLDHARAWTLVVKGLALSDTVANDELRWRLAAIGHSAALARGDSLQATRMKALLVAARDRLRARWQTAMDRYDARPDLMRLQTSTIGSSSRGDER